MVRLQKKQRLRSDTKAQNFFKKLCSRGVHAFHRLKSKENDQGSGLDTNARQGVEEKVECNGKVTARKFSLQLNKALCKIKIDFGHPKSRQDSRKKADVPSFGKEISATGVDV